MIQYILYPIFPNGNIFQNCSEISQPSGDIDTVKMQSISITKGFLILSFYSHTYFSRVSTPFLTLDKDYSVLHFFNFVISTMS